MPDTTAGILSGSQLAGPGEGSPAGNQGAEQNAPKSLPQANVTRSFHVAGTAGTARYWHRERATASHGAAWQATDIRGAVGQVIPR